MKHDDIQDAGLRDVPPSADSERPPSTPTDYPIYLSLSELAAALTDERRIVRGYVRDSNGAMLFAVATAARLSVQPADDFLDFDSVTVQETVFRAK